MSPSSSVGGQSQHHASSFRDPSGFVFVHGEELYRQVNRRYSGAFDHLMQSGLYDCLVKKGLLIPHRELAAAEAGALAMSGDSYKVLRPERVKFISYPCEWTFSQLKDAALATLEIQRYAFAHGMTLKDATAYNIQFVDGRPTLIDTLSFDHYREGEPWVAYRQYCQHFLAPLLLMSMVDVRLGQLSRVHLDGVPLDLASRLLPRKTWISPSTVMHLHLHARAQAKFADKGRSTASRGEVKARQVGRLGFQGLIDSLSAATAGRRWCPAGTEWGDYYGDTNYSDTAIEQKGELVRELAAMVAPTPRLTLDLGANTGFFSRMLAGEGGLVIAADIDPAAVEKSYLSQRGKAGSNVLPLLLDVTNPTPSYGFALDERQGLFNRGQFDLVVSLALIHHMAISNNLPLQKLADFYCGVAPWLLIEFVPKTDSQVRRLLASREDIFDDYDSVGFERAFGRRFEMIARRPISGTERALYLWRRV